MKSVYLVSLAILLLFPFVSPAQSTTVRVVFYTGTVTVKARSIAIGQELSRSDVVAIGANATLQLSVNGKVLRYNKQTSLRIADAIRQAGNGENTAVANTVRTLAAASGAEAGRRTSQAGATRFDGDRAEATAAARVSLNDMRNLANQELSKRLGIDNALFRFEEEVKSLYGEDDMLILEPRACASTIGPILFRWLRSPTAGGYVVTVRDHLGDKVYEATTNDTSVVWNAPTLVPGVLYSWKLSDQRNSLHSVQAHFWQLDQSSNAAVTAGLAAIRLELGNDNPALPLVTGAFLQDNACYGEASRAYVTGAEETPERYKDFVDRALDVYAYDLGMSLHELMMLTPKQ